MITTAHLPATTRPLRAARILARHPALLGALFSTCLTACGAIPRAESRPVLEPLALDPAPPDTPLARAADPGKHKPAVDPGKSKPRVQVSTRAMAKAEPVVAPRVTAEGPAPEPVELEAVRGSQHLARLHPEVRRMARALYTAAAAEGIELKFISGHRAFDRHSAKAKAGKASWHAFGMAFDVNLVHHKDMKAAIKRYRSEKAQWDRVGAIAERLGLTWGLQWGTAEVFHFEWHPGMPEAIRRPTLTALLKDAGADGKAIEKVWRRFPLPGETDEALASREDR